MKFNLLKTTKTERYMKNFKLMLHMVAACGIAIFAVSCSNDDVFVEKSSGGVKTITLTACNPGYESDAHQSQTRVAFDSKGKAYWHAGDTIGVWSYGEKKFKPFVLVDGAGTGVASFKGEVVDSAGCVVYPYNEKDVVSDDYYGVSNNRLEYYLPDSYVYETVDQTLFPEDKNGNSFMMPMLGTITKDNVVIFKHLGGVICLRIDEMPSEDGMVIVSGTNQISGTFAVGLSSSSPQLESTSLDNFAECHFSSVTKGSKGVFYIPVAPGNYNLTIGVCGSDKCSSSTADVEITRARLQVVDVKTDYKDRYKTINGHRFVDLGLSVLSSVLWAETNVGAESATDYGGYFAWGETKEKTEYNLSTYKYCEDDSITKYNDTDKLTTLQADDDAATANWGKPCRMPSGTELSVLWNECTLKMVTLTTDEGESVYGCKVTSKMNGNSIFLPASGYFSSETGRIEGWGSCGCYWGGTCLKGRNASMYDTVIPYSVAEYLFFDEYMSYFSYSKYRQDGYTIRPVAEP